MVIFTRLPERSTDPSMTASVFNSLAISGKVLVLSLYPRTEVQEITLRLLILVRVVISSSVVPSAKYSCLGSPDRFFNGSTAKEWISGTATAGVGAGAAINGLERCQIRQATPVTRSNVTTMVVPSRASFGFGLCRISLPWVAELSQPTELSRFKRRKSVAISTAL